MKKLIEIYAPRTIKIKKLSDLKYTTKKFVAIDLSILLYQTIGVFDKKIFEKYPNFKPHLRGIFWKTLFLLERNILPIFVFDGEPPIVKNDSLKKRKNNIKLSENIINESKEFIKMLNLPYVKSPSEADPILASLSNYSNCIGVITQDFDILVYGGKNILKEFKIKNKFYYEINLKCLLKELKINYNSFVDLAILLGSDYMEKINGIGLVQTYKLIKKYKIIEKIVNILNLKLDNKFYEKLQITRNIFRKKSFFKIQYPNKKINIEKIKVIIENDNAVKKFLRHIIKFKNYTIC